MLAEKKKVNRLHTVEELRYKIDGWTKKDVMPKENPTGKLKTKDVTFGKLVRVSSLGSLSESNSSFSEDT